MFRQEAKEDAVARIVVKEANSRGHFRTLSLPLLPKRQIRIAVALVEKIIMKSRLCEFEFNWICLSLAGKEVTG